MLESRSPYRKRFCRSARLGLLAAFWLMVAGAAQSSAQVKLDANTIIEKAIKAHGGEGKINNLKEITTVSSGIAHLVGGDVPFVIKCIWKAPERDGDDFSFLWREECRYTVDGKRETLTKIVRNRTSRVFDGNEIGTDESEEDRRLTIERLYERFVTTCLPALREKQFSLLAIGELVVNGKPALGVRVEHKKYRSRDLYFDKETGLLVKLEDTMVLSGKKVKREAILSDYKEVDGIMHARQLVMFHDGIKRWEQQRTEIKVNQEVKDEAFHGK